MEGAREFLEQVRQHQMVKGHFRGLLHLLIGRKISLADGTLLCSGLTWRQLSELLKLMRWDKESVRELGLDPDSLPPRDRLRYWYTAITSAQITSTEAENEADALVPLVGGIGFVVTRPLAK